MNRTITAVSTAPGAGGIAVIRISGTKAIEIADSAWKGKSLTDALSHTAHLGKYYSTSGDLLDEAVATIFRAPASFTGEDVVEISVHGSRWIQKEIIADLIRRGAYAAAPGEFTQRAFINGRLDLAQAEGVADLIASSSRAAHKLAISQTRGGFSRELELLREKLVDFASLLELELDFSEEDVEFADRTRLSELGNAIMKKITRLANSYSSGAALKNGVPVVIAGIPNAGKSSLLNLLLNDDKAIVSDIPGTTRDIIEDTAEIDGILYRFIDTAGLRTTSDKVEKLGIERARLQMTKASIIIWIIDPTSPLQPQTQELDTFISNNPGSKIILLQNKSDINNSPLFEQHHITASTAENRCKSVMTSCMKPILFSAYTGEGLEELIEKLHNLATDGYNPDSDLIVTNARHYQALLQVQAPLRQALAGIDNGISADFIAQDIRETLHHLGTITGSITTDTLLHTIFSRFCIGK